MKRIRRSLSIFLTVVMFMTCADFAALAEAVLTLPKALKVIDEEAFYGDQSIDKVVVPDGTTEIRARAFANSSLTEINLPDSLQSIADDAFDGSDLTTVTVSEGTYAYERALEIGLIHVESVVDLSIILLEANVDYCEPLKDTIVWNAVAAGGVGKLSYSFKCFNGTDCVATSPWSMNGEYCYVPTMSGSYSVICTVRDEEGNATSLASDLVSVYPKLSASDLTLSVNEITAGDTIDFSVTAIGGMSPYQYILDIYLGDSLQDQIVSRTNTIPYMVETAGNYHAVMCVCDAAGTSIYTQSVSFKVNDPLPEFRITTPENGYIHSLEKSEYVRCTEITGTDTYWFVMTDTTTGMQVFEKGKSSPKSNLSLSYFVPGHQYSIYVRAEDENEQVLGVTESVHFFTNPDALGTKLNILYPSKSEDDNEITKGDPDELIAGEDYVIVDPVPNATWYYAKFVPKYEQFLTITTDKVSTPYILVPAALSNGFDSGTCTDYKIYVYAGNDGSKTVSESIYWINIGTEGSSLNKGYFFTSKGGTFTISTTTKTKAWTSDTDADWVTISPASGTGSQTVTVNVLPNQTGEARVCHFYVSHSGYEWYTITQSEYSDIEIRPVPTISGWDGTDVGAFCERVDGNYSYVEFSGIVSGGKETLEYTKIVIEDQKSDRAYLYQKITPTNNQVNLSTINRLYTAQKYTDSEGNVFDSTKPGTYKVKIYAKNNGGEEVCIATRTLYLSRDIYSYSITPNVADPALDEEVTWTFNYTGGGDGMKFKFILLRNGEKYDNSGTKYISENFYTFELTEYGRYTVRVLVDYGDCGEVFDDISSEVLLLKNESYTAPYISAANVSATQVEPGERVTWTINVRQGVKPYSYKYVIYKDGKQYDYVNYGEVTDNSYTLKLDKTGVYTAKLYAKDAYGYEVMQETDAVTVEKEEVVVSYDPSLDMSTATLDKSVYAPGDTITISGIRVKNANYVHFSGNNSYLSTKDVSVIRSASYASIGTVQFVLPTYTEERVDYYFSVTPVSSDGSGEINKDLKYIVSSSTVVGSAPKAPANVNVATTGTDSLDVSWSKSVGATSYTLYMSTSASGSYTEVVSQSDQSKKVTGLQAGKKYYFKVKASNSYGKSDFSSYAYGWTDEEISMTGAPSAKLTIPATANIGDKIVLSGSVKSNGGTLDLIRITVTDKNTGKFCDYGCYDAATIANYGSTSEFDLLNVWRIDTGAVVEAGYNPRTGSSSITMVENGTYVISVAAKNAGTSVLETVASAEVTLKKYVTPFVRITDAYGTLLTDKSGIVLNDWNAFSGKTIYLLTNIPNINSSSTNDSFELENWENYQYTADGTLYTLTLKGSQNPYGKERNVVFTFKSDGTTYAQFTVTQAANPNVPSSELDLALTNRSMALNPTLAKISVDYAALAYGTAKSVADKLEKDGFEIRISEGYNHPRNEHYVGYSIASKVVKRNDEEHTIYAVIIRGTLDSIEWLYNFNLGTGTTHLDFNACAISINTALNKVIDEDGAENVHVWITGHSRGAAVANLLAKRCVGNSKIDYTYAYTFATPAVSTSYDTTLPIYNYVRRNDLIPMLPPEKWGYGRHGQTIYFGKISPQIALIPFYVRNMVENDPKRLANVYEIIYDYAKDYLLTGYDLSLWDILCYLEVEITLPTLTTKLNEMYYALGFEGIDSIDNVTEFILSLTETISLAKDEYSNIWDNHVQTDYVTAIYEMYQ